MAVYSKVIFVCRDNVCQSPIAAAILNSIKRDEWLDSESRGLVVLFPEPYSTKAYSLLSNNGIRMESGTSCQLEEKDFADDTIILTMTKEEKQKIIDEYANAKNIYTIMEFAGGSGDIMDPYGGDAEIYMMFYTSISTWVKQVENRLHEINA